MCLCVWVCFRFWGIQHNPFGFLSLRTRAGVSCLTGGQLGPSSVCIASWILLSKVVENPLWAAVIHQFSTHLEAHPSLPRGYNLAFLNHGV